MRKHIKTLIIIFFISSSLSLTVKAANIVPINNLIEYAKELDGQEVTVQGEAIGERMDRGNYSWVNLNDGTNAMGIWLSKNDSENIVYYGNYKFKGDTVKITGIFHRACNEHGGEADLHGESIEIVQKGHIMRRQISSAKIIAALISIAFALFFLIFFIKTVKPIKTKI